MNEITTGLPARDAHPKTTSGSIPTPIIRVPSLYKWEGWVLGQFWVRIGALYAEKYSI